MPGKPGDMVSGECLARSGIVIPSRAEPNNQASSGLGGYLQLDASWDEILSPFRGLEKFISVHAVWRDYYITLAPLSRRGAAHGRLEHRYSPQRQRQLNTPTHYTPFNAPESPRIQCMDSSPAQTLVPLMRRSPLRRPSLTPLR